MEEEEEKWRREWWLVVINRQKTFAVEIICDYVGSVVIVESIKVTGCRIKQARA